MLRKSTVEIYKDEFSFSAGHFTIFSATEREDLHGHNYNLSVALTTQLSDQGLSFDYRFYKKILSNLCNQLDRKFLLPAHSQFLRIEECDDMVFAHFNNERIPFLKRDIVILPISNVTLEELADWALQQLLQHKSTLQEHKILSVVVKAFNGPGQSGSSSISF